MKRDHTVYILGAGFSARAGVPVIKNFLDRVRRNYEDPDGPSLDEPLERHYKRVLDYRHDIARVSDYVSLELDNVEVLFSLLEMDTLLANSRRELLASMRHVICHTVAADIDHANIPKIRINVEDAHRTRLLATPGISDHRVESNGESPPLRLEMSMYTYAVALMLGMFQATATGRKCTIVSLNYDTVVEQALWKLGRSVDYAATRFSVQTDHNKVSGVQNSVRLLKLHGSSNWARAGKQNVRANVYSRYEDFGPNRMPLIIPPTWRKGDMGPAYTEIWKAAGHALQEATKIVVIGYSLPVTDQHVRHLLTTALSRNPGIHSMYVVDLEHDPPAEVRSRYKRLFAPLEQYGRLTFDGSGFEGYFRELRNDPNVAGAIASIAG